MENSAKETKKGSDFVFSTLNDWDLLFWWYMSNATKFRPDYNEMKNSAKKHQED